MRLHSYSLRSILLCGTLAILLASCTSTKQVATDERDRQAGDLASALGLPENFRAIVSATQEYIIGSVAIYDSTRRRDDFITSDHFHVTELIRDNLTTISSDVATAETNRFALRLWKMIDATANTSRVTKVRTEIAGAYLFRAKTFGRSDDTPVAPQQIVESARWLKPWRIVISVADTMGLNLDASLDRMKASLPDVGVGNYRTETGSFVFEMPAGFYAMATRQLPSDASRSGEGNRRT